MSNLLSGNSKDLQIAFLMARCRLAELISGVFTQSIKPEDIPSHLTKILNDLSDSVNVCCVLKDVSGK